MNFADNRVELTGFAGSDLEIKDLASSKKLGKVSIAVNENYIGANGMEVRNTSWFNLIFWNAKVDEAHPIVKKGARFSVAGRLSIQQYEKDGIKRYSTEIIVHDVAAAVTAADPES